MTFSALVLLLYDEKKKKKRIDQAWLRCSLGWTMMWSLEIDNDNLILLAEKDFYVDVILNVEERETKENWPSMTLANRNILSYNLLCIINFLMRTLFLAIFSLRFFVCVITLALLGCRHPCYWRSCHQLSEKETFLIVNGKYYCEIKYHRLCLGLTWSMTHPQKMF